MINFKLSDSCRSKVLVLKKDIRFQMNLKAKDYLRINYDEIENEIIIYHTTNPSYGDKQLRKNNSFLVPKKYLDLLGVSGYYIKGYISKSELHLTGSIIHNDNDLEILKRKIDLLLDKKSLTYKELNDLCLFKEKKINYVLSGRNNLTYDFLKKISNVLEVDLVYLITNIEYEYYELIKVLKKNNIKPNYILDILDKIT